MFNYHDTALEGKDEALGNEHFQVIVVPADHPQYLFGIADKSIIVARIAR
jgi:hypothetical protein